MSKRTGCSSGEALWAQRHPLCPHRKGVQDSVDLCNFMDCVCFMETHDGYCQTYQDYIKELEEVK